MVGTYHLVEKLATRRRVPMVPEDWSLQLRPPIRSIRAASAVEKCWSKLIFFSSAQHGAEMSLE